MTPDSCLHVGLDMLRSRLHGSQHAHPAASLATDGAGADPASGTGHRLLVSEDGVVLVAGGNLQEGEEVRRTFACMGT